MNAIHHLDHLCAPNHLASALQLGAAAARQAANLPRSASTTHYGPDGKRVAAKSKTSYANLRLSKDGQINGGKLEHASKGVKGEPIDSSTVVFGAHGCPTEVNTAVNNRFKPGLFKKVETDLSGINWTAANSVHSGQARIRIRHANTDAVHMTGKINFDNESIQTGAFSHYAGDGEVHHHTEVDYRKARLIGSRMTGGYCTIQQKDKNGRLQAHSNLFMSPQGHVAEIHTRNFHPETAALKSSVVTDFSGVRFDARHQILEGDISLTTTCPKGSIRSTSMATFENNVPRKVVTQQKKSGRNSLKMVTDYSKSSFDNNLKVVDSDAVTSVYNAKDKLISTTTVSYDADGNFAGKVTKRIKPGSKKVLSTRTADYANAEFNLQGEAVGGYVAVTTRHAGSGETIHEKKSFASIAGKPVANANAGTDSSVDNPARPAPTYRREFSVTTNDAGITTSRVEKILRADGTLLRKSATEVRAGVPVSTVISSYATDGKTVIGTDSLDLAKLKYDAGKNRVSGQVAVKSMFRGMSRSASSKLQY